MAGRGRIEYQDAPADVMNRLVAGTRKGVEAAARNWDDRLLPGHFEDDAAEKYDYTPRSGEGEPAWVPSARGIVVAGGRSKYGAGRVKQNPRYFWAKQRAGKGRTPLVYSGATRQMAIAGGRVSSRARGETVEATDAIPVSRDFFKRPKDSRVDKPKELTAVTRDEESGLARVVEQTAAREAERGGRRRTVVK